MTKIVSRDTFWGQCFGDSSWPAPGVILLDGVPGSGKTTMALQLADAYISLLTRPVCYLSNCEDVIEIAKRARRLELKHAAVMRCQFSAESAWAYERSPLLIVVDLLPSADKVAEMWRHSAIFGTTFLALANGDDDQLVLDCEHEADVAATLLIDPEDGVRYFDVYKNRFGGDVSRDFQMTSKGLVQLPVARK